MMRPDCPYLVIKLVPFLQDITRGVGSVVAALQVAEVVGDGVEVEVRELVVEPRYDVVAQIEVSQVEIDKILLLPGVHPILIEPTQQSKVDSNTRLRKIPVLPAQVDDQKWRELDDIGLLADLPGPLAKITLKLVDPLLLQIHFETFPETGPDKTRECKNCHQS